MPVRVLALGALIAPQLAAALPWDGRYRLSAEANCSDEAGVLRIAEGVLHGVESTCRMTDPVDVLDLDATLYVMECSGEGETWTERAMLMDAAEGDGIYLMWRGYAFRYDRCPASDEKASAEEAPGDASD
ncbi:hypothetical protein FHG66_09945 [Rubellimicrobium rubrum]|uniref:DUF3617 family protein n=1 Tax=Rubellimicrobium rubrum TaxID=2585369 RepID=A0A5C4MUQ2_9RHOB|nr:hypothetical protein [Rubellimicrobium rubrum]TNC49827.1 hypothetical protein FHG66_09945 [Rubellimicrobium rubrum]